MKHDFIVRQGDVLLVNCLKTPEQKDIGKELHRSDDRGVILAFGEVTGHAHAVKPESVPVIKNVELYELDNTDQKYALTSFNNVELLCVKEKAFLRHEEHAPIIVPAGDYVAIRQHEYDDSEELRRVAD